jgi:hypothetical protein
LKPKPFILKPHPEHLSGVRGAYYLLLKGMCNVLLFSPRKKAPGYEATKLKRKEG